MLGPLLVLALMSGTLAMAVVAVRRRRVGVVLGYLAGVTLLWALRPTGWPLGLLETMQATVDSATYGHAVEHGAENLVLWMMVFGLVGAAARLVIPERFWRWV